RRSALLLRHVITRPLPRLQFAARHQPVVGLGHGVLGNTQRTGRSANRQNLLARLPLAYGDLLLYVAHAKIYSGCHCMGPSMGTVLDQFSSWTFYCTHSRPIM